ncbi:MAG: FkbM family methyltransferase [Pseudomonadota bacterium]
MRAPPRLIRRAPLIREPLRRFMKRHAPRGPLTRTVEGLTFELAPRDNKVDFDIWYKGRLEEGVERRFLAKAQPEGGVFVDIGANIGLYTLALLRDRPDARAIAIEPLARLRARLFKNLAANGLSATIRAEAVGPAGEADLFESLNAGASSLLSAGQQGGVQRVTVRPLAEILADEGVRAHAIKIDVEGFEDEALMPFFDTVPRENWPVAVVMETLHRAAWRRDCLLELLEQGYQIKEQTAENVCLRRWGN